MNDVVSSIQGVFALAALIAGLSSGRPKRAAVWGAVVGAICAALFLAVVASAGVRNIDISRFAGHLIGLIGGCALFGLLGYAIKRGVRRLFGGSQQAPSP
jgi:hypothetical protein